MPSVNRRPVTREANCCARACSVAWPMACVAVWMMPARGMRFHQLDQRGQAVAAHHAVGVEHHHVAVVPAPAAAEVGHVAGLAVRAARRAGGSRPRPAAGSGCAGQRGAQVFPGGALGGGDLGACSCRTARTRRTAAPWPVAATDSQVARRPANTVATSSLQIGMMIAVRASGSSGGRPPARPTARAGRRARRRRSPSARSRSRSRPRPTAPRTARSGRIRARGCRSRAGRAANSAVALTVLTSVSAAKARRRSARRAARLPRCGRGPAAPCAERRADQQRRADAVPEAAPGPGAIEPRLIGGAVTEFGWRCSRGTTRLASLSCAAREE